MRHEIRLLGKGLRGDRIDGRLLRALVAPLVDGAQEAVRLLAEGRSRARAPRPGWLQRDAAFELVMQPVSGEGQHVLRVESQALGKSDPARFAQGELFDRAALSEKSGIDLFEDALEAALKGDRESDLYDEGLLDTLLGMGAAFDLGVDAIEVVNGRVVPVDAEGLERIARLRRETPPPQQVRVSGTLDVLEGTRSRFALRLDDGTRIAAVSDNVPDDELRQLWKRSVTVSGRAFFHPSGRLRRIEADWVRPATEVDRRAFAEPPTPLFSSIDTRSFRVRQGPEDGLNAIFGRWPEEDDSPDADAAIGARR